MSNVEHPAHYAEGRKYEPIDVINDWGLDFDLGNVVKYISRAGRKGSMIEDLEKAAVYLNDEITRLYSKTNIDKERLDGMLSKEELDSLLHGLSTGDDPDDGFEEDTNG